MDIRIHQQPFNRLLLDITQPLLLNGTYSQNEPQHHELIGHDHKHKALRLLIGLHVFGIGVNVWHYEGGDTVGGRAGDEVEDFGDEIGSAMVLG